MRTRIRRDRSFRSCWTQPLCRGIAWKWPRHETFDRVELTNERADFCACDRPLIGDVLVFPFRVRPARWAGLTRFVEDPRIPLDNNAAERALRGPVVGRKNHYGSRSLRGTEVAAVCYTLCETARLVGVDPRECLLRAVYAAIGRPGTVTFPEDLLASTLTG